MSDKKSYIELYELGEPMDGPAVGRVLASNAEGFAPGDHAVHVLGWRDHAVLDASPAQKVDPNLAPLSTYLGVSGLTAYVGLKRFAEINKNGPVAEQPAQAAPDGIDAFLALIRGENVGKMIVRL